MAAPPSGTAREARQAAGAALASVIVMTQAGQAVTFTILPAVLPSVSLYFGGGARGDMVAQWLAVFPFLGLTIGGLISGWMIALLGMRLLVLLASAGYALAGIIGLVAPQAAVLLGGSLLLGLAAAFMTSGLSGITARTYEGAARARVLGYQTAFANFCSVAFGLGAAFAAQYWGWRTPFAVYLGIGLMVFLLSLPSLPGGRGDNAGSGAHLFAVLGKGWRVYLAGGFAFMVATTQTTQLPFLLDQNGISSSGLRAVVMTCSTICAFAGALFYSAGQARLGEGRMAAIGIGATALGFALYGLWSGGLAVACLASALLGLALGLFVPIFFGAAMRVVDQGESGQSIGLLNCGIFLGSFLNPVVVAPLRRLVDLSQLMLVSAAVVLAVGLAVWPYIRGRSRRRLLVASPSPLSR